METKNLTSRQKELIEIAKTREVTKKDINAIWTSPISRQASVERLVALGILKEVGDKLVYVED